SRQLGAQKWRKIHFDATVSGGSRPVGDSVSLTPGLNNSFGAITNAADGKTFAVQGKAIFANGPIGQGAIEFFGHTQLETDRLEKPTTNGWIFSAWVRRDMARPAALFSTAKFSLPESADEYGAGVQILLTADGKLEARAATGWPGYAADVVSKQVIGVGDWRHVAVACDGSTKAAGLRLFMDGRECGREVIHNDLTGPVNIEGKALIGFS